MNTNTSVEMSNQIGHFFDSMPERDQPTLDIAMHLKRFWAPSMRRRLLEQAGQQGAAHLRQIVRDAISRHADLIGEFPCLFNVIELVINRSRAGVPQSCPPSRTGYRRVVWRDMRSTLGR